MSNAAPHKALCWKRRWIEPNLAIGARATPASPIELRHAWESIVNQVADKPGLALGVRLDAPPQAHGNFSQRLADALV
jgi:hypothetical protein